MATQLLLVSRQHKLERPSTNFVSNMVCNICYLYSGTSPTWSELYKTFVAQAFVPSCPGCYKPSRVLLSLQGTPGCPAVAQPEQYETSRYSRPSRLLRLLCVIVRAKWGLQGTPGHQGNSRLARAPWDWSTLGRPGNPGLPGLPGAQCDSEVLWVLPVIIGCL